MAHFPNPNFPETIAPPEYPSLAFQYYMAEERTRAVVAGIRYMKNQIVSLGDELAFITPAEIYQWFDDIIESLDPDRHQDTTP